MGFAGSGRNTAVISTVAALADAANAPARASVLKRLAVVALFMFHTLPVTAYNASI
jgi:hypothetical protein